MKKMILFISIFLLLVSFASAARYAVDGTNFFCDPDTEDQTTTLYNEYHNFDNGNVAPSDWSCRGGTDCDFNYAANFFAGNGSLGGVGDHVNFTEQPEVDIITYDFFYRPNNTATNSIPFYPYNGLRFGIETNNKFRITCTESGEGCSDNFDMNITYTAGEWYKIGIIVNYTDNTTDFHIFNATSGNLVINGSVLDVEVTFNQPVWLLAFTTEEGQIDNFREYNGSACFLNASLLSFNISSGSIANNTQYARSNINFNVTGNFSRSTNCTLFINDTLNESKNVSIGNDVVVNYSRVMADGTYTYNINCYDSKKNDSTTTNIFHIDTVDPVITDNFINGTRTYLNNLTGQFNFSDSDVLFSYNITIDNFINVANATNLNTNFFIFNLSYNVTNLAPGTHTLNVRLADGHTSKRLKEDYDFDNGVFNDYSKYIFSDGWIQTESKSKSMFDSWTSKKEVDRYTQIYIPANPSETQVFVEKSDTPIYITSGQDKYKGSWIIVGEHWKDYVLQGEPDSEVTIKRINNYEVEVTISGIKNKPEELIFESIGDLNIVTKNYTFSRINVSENFTGGVFRGFDTELFLTIFRNDSNNPNVVLEWNNTNFSTSIVTTNASEITYKSIFTPTQIVNNFDDVLHRWHINLTTNETTVNQTQVYFTIEVGTCENNKTFQILNISYFDEITNEPITVDNSYNVKIFDGTFYYNQTGSFSGSVNNTFCTNINPANQTYNWDLWDTFALSKTDYVSRVIDIPEAFPLSISNNPKANLSLFMINVTASTSVTFTWFTTAYEVIDGVMLVYRCNPDGSRSLTESVNIVGGEATVNLQLLTQLYSYEIIIGGERFTNEEGFTKCHTESSTTRQFFVDIGDITITDLIGLSSTPCTLVKVNNNTVNMSWGLNPENSSIIQGCIQGYRTSNLGSIKIFENCSSNSTQQNNLINSIPLNTFTYNVKGKLIQGGNIVWCADEVIFDRSESSALALGASALFGIILLIIALGLVYAGDGELQLVGVGIALLTVAIFGLLNVPLTAVLSMEAFLIIIVLIGRYTRK